MDDSNVSLAGLETDCLPSANFQLDSSDEACLRYTPVCTITSLIILFYFQDDEEGGSHALFPTTGNTNGSDLLIFSRAQHMKAAGVTVYDDLDEESNHLDDSISTG